MANLNRLVQGVSQQFNQNSLSWGSLLVWISGLVVIMMLMVRFSQIY
ncbi:MAG: hypothetical protein CLLPBCKN_001134 [Chroococcidiopsis cubana SAG 39.79]|uniref:Uncharacterized protein n=1 Tax=Chroococcidiopsis thermalis (strain PCC 7203) TaxID=251229 RepID=K9U0B7_CHRTP|nr:hypothetical protein Chro_3065 [Chroococcidiopsis thermalis PCC 7203]MDZ4871746.1 hypothetical protein [Chroococcidiopsis cubana SAG 39.79]